MLVRHASTAAVARAAFADDEPLDEHGHAQATALGSLLPPAAEVLSSPSRRALETAADAGLEAPTVDEQLVECDFGSWTGHTLAEVHAEDPAAVEAWMTDASAAPHGGESIAALVLRVGAWLDAQATLEGTVIAVTHGGVIRAAVVHVLRAAPKACWHIEIAPASLTELRAHEGGWMVVRVNSLT